MGSLIEISVTNFQEHWLIEKKRKKIQYTNVTNVNFVKFRTKLQD